MEKGNTVEIALVGAMAENGVIGRGNKLLWRLPADMAWFRAVTRGCPVIMGRLTYESIGRPLPGRRNIVLTRQPSFEAPGVETAHSVEAALALAEGAERICVIGGGVVYEEFLPHANAMYVTHILHTFEGDARFPAWNDAEWTVVREEEGPYDVKNPYRFCMKEYRRT
ncbi:dihydrofolate reductase [Paenibacillus sp. TRM 82003]|nr:dihydrofolate reductase [Paenibacillus sp. TRM 82003]